MSSLFTFLLVLALVYAARDQQPGDRAKKPKPKPNKPKPKPTTTTKPQPEYFNPLPSDARQECYDCLAALASVCGRDCFTGDDDKECFSCVFEHNPGCLPACGFPAASTKFCSESNFCPKSGGPGSGSCQEPVTGQSPVPMLPVTGETPVTMPTVETTGAPGGNGTGGTVAAPIRPNGCTVEWGINYNGNDLRHQRAKDWVQCADLCDQLEQCTVWTYNFETEICFLKTSNSGREVSSNNLSGTKECEGGTVAAPIRPNGCTVEWGINYNGNDLRHQHAKDWVQCADLCDQLEQCTVWTYNFETEICFLKTSNSGREVSSNNLSGTKECEGGTEAAPIRPIGGTQAAGIRPNGCTVEWGFDYYDADGNIPGHRGYAVKDMEQCMDDCAALEQCNDWTYQPRLSSCWLKTSSSGRKAADYAISGAKMCGASVEG